MNSHMVNVALCAVFALAFLICVWALVRTKPHGERRSLKEAYKDFVETSPQGEIEEVQPALAECDPFPIPHGRDDIHPWPEQEPDPVVMAVSKPTAPECDPFPEFGMVKSPPADRFISSGPDAGRVRRDFGGRVIPAENAPALSDGSRDFGHALPVHMVVEDVQPFPEKTEFKLVTDAAQQAQPFPEAVIEDAREAVMPFPETMADALVADESQQAQPFPEAEYPGTDEVKHTEAVQKVAATIDAVRLAADLGSAQVCIETQTRQIAELEEVRVSHRRVIEQQFTQLTQQAQEIDALKREAGERAGQVNVSHLKGQLTKAKARIEALVKSVKTKDKTIAALRAKAKAKRK